MGIADDVRAAQQTLWDRFSLGWEKWDPVVLATNGPVGDEIIRSLEIADDGRHLDVAAGTGEPGLTIAAMSPRGKVVITDISSGMLAAAQRRASAQRLGNVEFRECSADMLPFDEASFDTVSCRFGFMFFPNLPTAAAELVRVLKPGGRLAAAVWAGPEDNAWATIPGSAIASEVTQPAPDPEAPGMFRCATPGAMTQLLESAGLGGVHEWDVAIELVADSPDQYWLMLTELTAPVVAVLGQVDAATQQRIASKVIDAARTFESNGKVRLPGTARCVAGTK